MFDSIQFPRQALPSRRKGKKWRWQCMQWADSKSLVNYNPTRTSVRHKKVNYDLIRGIIHMEDVAQLLNPGDIDASYIPEKIQHFPIMNAKLQVLIGEELKRPFNWKVTVTNMNALSDMENMKKEMVLQHLQQTIEDSSLSEEDYQARLEELSEYSLYHYQDFRERRANEYLKHYVKEFNLPLLFNDGFWDALTVGEELYLLDIVGGEPFIEKIDPNEVRIYRHGRSNKVEDADVVIIESYWQPGRILDTYGDKLKQRDIDYLENLPDYLGNGIDSLGNVDERMGMIPRTMLDESFTFNDNDFLFSGTTGFDGDMKLMPYDNAGNVRVLRMFWKSYRKIKKVTWLDAETGKPTFSFFSEDYVPDEDAGEESEDLYINEAWEGTLIGGASPNFEKHSTDGNYGILVNVQPRPMQFNRLTNPSRCHLGIVGTIYNINGGKPYSMVDMMKPYNYMYDVLHYRIQDTLASSWGSMVDVDLATIPYKWDMDKWLYFAKVNHMAIRDSFNEGQEGAAKGKIAGALNNNAQRVINDASAAYIQQLMNLAEWVKVEMGEITGVTKQREGQIANRETVGGVERSVLQSSYITERYFAVHNDTKRRTINDFLEVIKTCARGKNVKFKYIASDFTEQIMEFDGDEFAENDYGLVVDDSSDIINLEQKIEQIGQAAIQNQMVNLSDVLRLYTSTSSLAEKIRILQGAEEKRLQQAQQAQQMEMQQAQAQLQAQMQAKQMEMEHQSAMNTENNETKILIAQMQGDSKLAAAQMTADEYGIPEVMSETDKEKLKEQIREFDLKINQENKKLSLEKERNDIARISANKKSSKQ